MAARKKPAAKKTKAVAEENQPNGAAVVIADDGRLSVQPLGNTKPTEIPTILRVAAKNVEDALIDGG
jgi:hypothetical protein